MGCGSSKTVIVSDMDSKEMKNLRDKTSLEVTVIHVLYVEFVSFSKDKQLSKVDFINLYFHVHDTNEGTPLAKFLPRMYNAFDLDGNNSMDFEEFILMIDRMVNGNLDDKIKAIYRLCDDDRNGTIDRKELVDTMKSLVFLLNDDSEGPSAESVLEELANEVFDEMDKDGDGRLTLTEFVDGYLKTKRGREVIGLVFAGIIDVLLGGKLRQK